jgi:Bacterial protein of unknown function (DUF899)
MVEVDPTTKLIGADGPVPLIAIFDGRSQLIGKAQRHPMAGKRIMPG